MYGYGRHLCAPLAALHTLLEPRHLYPFGGDPEVLEQARRGELDHWADTSRGRLALIVVLDQFSRNIYRGSPLSYSQDPKALELAVRGIDLGMDRE